MGESSAAISGDSDAVVRCDEGGDGGEFMLLLLLLLFINCCCCCCSVLLVDKRDWRSIPPAAASPSEKLSSIISDELDCDP